MKFTAPGREGRDYGGWGRFSGRLFIMTKQRTILLTIVALSVPAAVAAFCWLPVTSYLERFADGVRAAGNWGPVVMAAIYVLATVLFIPGGLLTLLAGFLFGVVKGTITVSLGSVAGAAAAFWLGRGVARDWVQHRFAQSDLFRAINAAVKRQSFRIVLLVRLSPVFPFVFTNYAFSLTKIRFRDFLLASWIGMLPATVLYVYLGSLAHNFAELISGDVGDRGMQTIFLLLGVLATAAVVFLTARAAQTALRSEVK